MAWRHSSSLVAYASCVLASASWTGPFEPARWESRETERGGRESARRRARSRLSRAHVCTFRAFYTLRSVDTCKMHVRCRPRPVSFFLNSVNVYTRGDGVCKHCLSSGVAWLRAWTVYASNAHTVHVCSEIKDIYIYKRWRKFKKNVVLKILNQKKKVLVLNFRQHFPRMGNLYTFLWKGKEKEKEITTTYLGAITLRFHFLYHSSGGAAHYLTRRLKSSRNACLPRFTGLALIDRRGVHVAERRWPRNGDKLLACNCRLRGYYRSSFFPSG